MCANCDHVCLWGTYQAARWGLLTNTHTISMASFTCTTSALAHDMALHNVLLTRYKRFDCVSPLHKHMLYCSVSPLNGNFIQLSVAVCPHNYLLILLQVIIFYKHTMCVIAHDDKKAFKMSNSWASSIYLY